MYHFIEKCTVRFSGKVPKSALLLSAEQSHPQLSVSTLSLKTEPGEVLLVGCSHSSVQNIIKEAIRLTDNQVSLLAGGYHLLPYDRNELNTVAKQLKNEYQVKRVAPAHCTGHLAFKILLDAYGDNYLFAGLGETIAFEK